jgi:hypothetical protein
MYFSHLIIINRLFQGRLLCPGLRLIPGYRSGLLEVALPLLLIHICPFQRSLDPKFAGPPRFLDGGLWGKTAGNRGG